MAAYGARMPFIVAASAASVAAVLCLPWFSRMVAKSRTGKTQVVEVARAG